MNDRYARGAARLAELDGTQANGRQAAYDALAEVAPDLRRFAVEFAYGDIHSRPGLDAAQRELITIGVLVALGGVDRQLRAHLTTGLNTGLAPHQLTEAILQTLPYAGFPRTINAMLIAGELLAEQDEFRTSKT